MENPFRYFNTSPEAIRLLVMMCIRHPLSPRQVEDLLFGRGIGICHETVRFRWSRFGPMFAAEARDAAPFFGGKQPLSRLVFYMAGHLSVIGTLVAGGFCLTG